MSIGAQLPLQRLDELRFEAFTRLYGVIVAEVPIARKDGGPTMSRVARKTARNGLYPKLPCEKIGYSRGMHLPSRLLIVMTLLVAGCGRSKMSPPDRTVTGGAGGAASSRWGTTFDGATEGRTPAGCSVFANAIASGFATGRSVVIVRFDYRTKRPLGYAQLNTFSTCTFYEETGARVCAKADSSLKLPFDPTKQGARLRTESTNRGPWGFYQSSSDSGGIIVLDDEFGTIFSASIPRKGEGEMLAPNTWSTKDLGVGCRPVKKVAAPSQAYDLRSGTKMTAAESEAVAALAQKTVLPGLWERSGGNYDVSLVLLYPRTAGDFDPQNAEYLVFLRGWTAVH